MASGIGDTSAPAHPQVLAAIAAVNEGQSVPYGGDEVTARVTQQFQHLFDAPVAVRWSLGGTGANVFALASAVERQESILCSDAAHIHVHECGAVSQATGSQLVTIPAVNGKLNPTDVRRAFQSGQHPHTSTPRVLSITNTAEFGTVYTADETRELAELAHEYDALLHVDGARIATAVAALDTDVRQLLTNTGVDLVSFGGTKAGTMFGEAVVFIRPELADNVHQKQISAGQLSAKTRYIAAQFEALLTDDLWLTGARNANSMATLLAKQLAEIPGTKLWPVEANIVFIELSSDVASQLEASGFFPYFPGTSIGRWVTAWNTTESDVDKVADLVRSAT